MCRAGGALQPRVSAGRGRAAAARRRGAAHRARAGARHQAVPRGAERGGRAAARARGARVSTQCARAPPPPRPASNALCCRFEADFGSSVVTVAFHVGAGGGAGLEGGVRLVRRADRMDVLL